jgi:hypothetical protein
LVFVQLLGIGGGVCWRLELAEVPAGSGVILDCLILAHDTAIIRNGRNQHLSFAVIEGHRPYCADSAIRIADDRPLGQINVPRLERARWLDLEVGHRVIDRIERSINSRLIALRNGDPASCQWLRWFRFFYPITGRAGAFSRFLTTSIYVGNGQTGKLL